MPFSDRQRRKTLQTTARNAVRLRPPITARPSSCRYPAGPRRSASRACASQASVSARRQVRGYGPVPRPRQAFLGATGRAVDAAHPAPGLRRQTGSVLLFLALCSSAQRDADLLAAAHQLDAPQAAGVARRLFQIAGTGDLLVIYGKN